HVSPVAEEIGDVFPVDVGVVSSVRPFLRALAERTRGWKRWDTRRAAALKQEYEAAMAAADHPGAKRIRTPFVVRRVRDVLDRSAVVVLDAGNYATYVRNLYPAWEPETYIDSDNMACLGSGFLMALGVKVARPDRPVVALVGDGGFIMGLHELETAVRERINVVAVVFNDFGFGNIRGYQREFYGERYVGCNFGNPDFALVARAFGAHGERVEDPAVLADALRRALDADRPAVVEVLTDPDELAPGLYSWPRS
ncbi:MAG TPA: thiamine pyrophosphate-dependent enzyme, partial [Chloroflexota bacterium]